MKERCDMRESLLGATPKQVVDTMGCVTEVLGKDLGFKLFESNRLPRTEEISLIHQQQFEIFEPINKLLHFNANI